MSTSGLFDLSGSSVLTSGASRGIGVAIARHMLLCGACVAINGYETDEPRQLRIAVRLLLDMLERCCRSAAFQTALVGKNFCSAIWYYRKQFASSTARVSAEAVADLTSFGGIVQYSRIR